MRFLSFRRKNENRSITFQKLWGSGAANVELLQANSIDTALSFVPVFAATRLLADSIASLPLQTYRESADGTHTQIADPALFTNPTQFGTLYDWIHRAVTSLVIRGNAYGLVTARDKNGYATQVEWLHPDQVGLQDNRTINPPVWYYYGRVIPDADMIHIPWFTLPGLILGQSPIAAYRTTLETGLHAQMYGRDWFRNGSIPSGVLETDQPVTKDQAELIKSRFKKSADGRDVVVIGSGAHFKPITVLPEEAQFLGTLKATANQIAAIYGIPPEMIGGAVGHPMTYHNAEQQNINFVTFTLQPYLTKLEMALSAQLPRGQYVKFNLDSLLRADTLTRYQAHHLALSDGWKSRDEVRATEDLPPLPDGQGEKPSDPQPPKIPVPLPPMPDSTKPPQGGSP
jgi:HK97 family phage portal protein